MAGAHLGDYDPAGLHGLQGLPLNSLRIPEPSVQVRRLYLQGHPLNSLRILETSFLVK